jgi:hypothetical protein
MSKLSCDDYMVDVIAAEISTNLYHTTTVQRIIYIVENIS